MVQTVLSTPMCEMPLVSFLRRLHFRSSLFVSIFGRTRRFNKRTVNNRVLVEEKPFIGKWLLE